MYDTTVTIHPLIWRRMLLKKIWGLQKPTVQNKEWLYLLEEETRNSIMIEWYFSNKKEIKAVISDKKYSENSEAILGYFDATSLVYEFWYQKYIENEWVGIRHSDIKTIHSLMFRGQDRKNPGSYRTSDILIQKAKIKPPHGYLVKANMDCLINFTATLSFSDADLCTSLAKVHTLFESIHPFEDGNGRTGRLLINFILLSLWLPNIIIKGIEREKEDYFSGLEHGEWWLYDFFPSNIPENIWVEKWDFSYLTRLLAINLYESIDYLLLSKYSEWELIPVNILMREKWYSESYGRKLIERGQLIAKKIGKTWHTHPDLWH